MATPFSRAFYTQETCAVAQQLLGQRIQRRLASGEILAGLIVETEAYLTDDPACHAYQGETPRNRTMFGPPGHAYVYFTYGLHMMLNVVCGPAGQAEAVLIRALEPREGMETMRRQRGGISDTRQLTNGPGKLAQALALTRLQHDGLDVTDPVSELVIIPHEHEPSDMVQTTRIGITKGNDSPWRYYIRGNAYVSRR
jgi:DNA-3-methyladenine glycosylase